MIFFNGYLGILCRKQQKTLLNVSITCSKIRGVRNPIQMSDIGFLKTKQNRTDLKIQKPKTEFPQFGFQKTDFGGLATVFHVVSFTIHPPT